MPERRTRAQIAGHDARFDEHDSEFEKLRARLSGVDTRVGNLRRDTAQRFALQDAFNRDTVTEVTRVRDDVANVRNQVDNVSQMVDWRPNKFELLGWVVLGLILGALVGAGGVYALNSYYDMSWSEFAKWRDIVVMALIGAVLGRIIGGNLMRRRRRKAITRSSHRDVSTSDSRSSLAWNVGEFPTEQEPSVFVPRDQIRL